MLLLSKKQKKTKITPRCKGMLHLKKKFMKKFAKHKNNWKVRDHCQYDILYIYFLGGQDNSKDASSLTSNWLVRKEMYVNSEILFKITN